MLKIKHPLYPRAAPNTLPSWQVEHIEQAFDAPQQPVTYGASLRPSSRSAAVRIQSGSYRKKRVALNEMVKVLRTADGNVVESTEEPVVDIEQLPVNPLASAIGHTATSYTVADLMLRVFRNDPLRSDWRDGEEQPEQDYALPTNDRVTWHRRRTYVALAKSSPTPPSVEEQLRVARMTPQEYEDYKRELEAEQKAQLDGGDLPVDALVESELTESLGVCAFSAMAIWASEQKFFSADGETEIQPIATVHSDDFPGVGSYEQRSMRRTTPIQAINEAA